MRYVVPQHICSAGEDEQVKLYFRVGAPDRKVRIQAAIGDKVVYGANKLYVNPGEMEEIRIDASAIGDGGGKPMVVSVVSREEEQA